MKKLDKILDNVMRFLMAVAMFALLAGGTWQIFTRWILRNPSTVTDEFLRYVLIWASMIGSAYCFYKDKHLALDLVKGIPFKLLYSILPISGIFIILARVLKYVQLFLDSKEKKGENA